jgi:hypothetical protein
MPSPTIAFDTSAINWMAKNGLCSESFIAALRSGFSVQLTGMVIGPPHEIIRLLILAHHSNPSRFDWQRVDIAAPEYARAIVERDFDDTLCLEEWKMQQHLEDELLNHWRQLGSKLEPLFVEKPSLRPKTFAKAVAIARMEPSILLAIGQGLYAKVTTVKLSDADIRMFMHICPPFRASCYAVLGSWYDCALKHPPPKKPAGRNDHMMAAYLPYCERFVTRDKKQTTRLNEIAVEAQISCDVRYYDEFLDSFSIASYEPI